jgi:hypothetical protein
MEREIIVTIEPDGSVSTQIKGVAGPDCMALTKKLVSGNLLECKKTEEYYAIPEAKVNLQAKLGG